MLGYDSLANFYKTNFTIVQTTNLRMTDIENMMPWEKMIHIDMINSKQ